MEELGVSNPRPPSRFFAPPSPFGVEPCLASPRRGVELEGGVCRRLLLRTSKAGWLNDAGLRQLELGRARLAGVCDTLGTSSSAVGRARQLVDPARADTDQGGQQPRRGARLASFPQCGPKRRAACDELFFGPLQCPVRLEHRRPDADGSSLTHPRARACGPSAARPAEAGSRRCHVQSLSAVMSRVDMGAPLIMEVVDSSGCG